MYLAYSLLLHLGLIVCSPYFLLIALKHGKYLPGLRQRFGSLPQLSGQPVVWLHCVSVGEIQAARPLAQRLKREFPNHDLVVSTTTITGQALARNLFSNQATAVFYYPLDFRWAVRRALKRINPSVVLIMETELWPNFLRECKRRDIPVALVNGRISPKSYRNYKLVTFFLGRVLPSLRIALMQSEADAQRLQTLGIPTDKVFVTGNLKFDVEISTELMSKTEEIRQRFSINSNPPLIVAASTHSGEEEIILESIKQLRAQQPVRLLIAPRHPERFNEVADLLPHSGLNWSRKTHPAASEDASADVILLDTIGELPATYSLAQIAFVGGSLIDKGGHNMVEPAAVGTAVATGAHIDNFKDIVKLMKEANAIVQLPALEGAAASAELSRIFDELLSNPSKREELGRRAKQMVTDNRGAADRTVKLIEPLFSLNNAQSS
jgi:3-deoxy-D-manno-octulosonic-acid transferase